MKIAVAGKGGTGKTTLSGSLARCLAARGAPVWAIDADTNPNLDAILGLPRGAEDPVSGLPRDLLQRDEETQEISLRVPATELVDRYGTVGPDGIGYLMMGKVDHAGSG